LEAMKMESSVVAIEPGTVTLDDFAKGTFLAAARTEDNSPNHYWSHLKSWWARRNDSDVLFMAYEHMKQDSPGTIRKVAGFLNIELDDELLRITEEHASLAFMQQHKDRFDDLKMREHSHQVAGIPRNSDSSKVRTGQVGESKQQLSTEVSEELDAIWQEQITAELGYRDYAAMIATLK